MATLQFTVFDGAGAVANSDPHQENIITIGGTTAQGAVIEGNGTYRQVVRIAVDADCWVNWGSNPTALANGKGGRMMSTGQIEYFQIKAGDKIAVITRA